MEQTPQKSVYIKSTLDDVDGVERDLTEYGRLLAEHIESMEQEIKMHLWITEDVVDPAAQTLLKTRKEVEKLTARIRSVRVGCESLPMEEAIPERAVTVASGVADDREGAVGHSQRVQAGPDHDGLKSRRVKRIKVWPLE